jgi:hypothetical protein
VKKVRAANGGGGILINELLRRCRVELGVLAVFLTERFKGCAPLAELGPSPGFVGGDPRTTRGRDEDRRQDGDDRHHREQLNQGKRGGGSAQRKTRRRGDHGNLSA